MDKNYFGSSSPTAIESPAIEGKRDIRAVRAVLEAV
jgi:hypothetical protein